MYVLLTHALQFLGYSSVFRGRWCLINAVEEIQRNLNAFATLAENKRVDIAIADNKVKIYINILPNV